MANEMRAPAEPTQEIAQKGDLLGALSIGVDRRDYTNLSELDLGLAFVLALHPQLAHADRREDYVDYDALPEKPILVSVEPKVPDLAITDPGFVEAMTLYKSAKIAHEVAVANYHLAMKRWVQDYRKWLVNNDYKAIVKDGSRTDPHAQAILLGDDIRRAAASVNSSFTGLHNPAQAGTGADVDLLRDRELIPVIIKAIQELHALINSDQHIERLLALMYERQHAHRA